MKTPQDLLPRRSLGAREAHRELRTAPGADSREAAATTGRSAGPSRGVRLPPLRQMAFSEPLPSDYYLG